MVKRVRTKHNNKQEQPAKRPLTQRQKRFVAEYMIDFNATQAAIRAGYSKAAAHVLGNEALKEPRIAEAVRKAADAINKRSEASAEKVIRELSKIAFSNVKDVLRWDGRSITVLPSTEIPDDVAACIASVQEQKDGSIKVTFHDKVRALEQLGKHFGLYEQPTDADTNRPINVFVGIPGVTDHAADRAGTDRTNTAFTL